MTTSRAWLSSGSSAIPSGRTRPVLHAATRRGLHGQPARPTRERADLRSRRRLRRIPDPGLRACTRQHRGRDPGDKDKAAPNRGKGASPTRRSADRRSVRHAEQGTLPSDEENQPVDTRVGRLAWKCIFGCDAEPRAARTAKMNMIMHGDGHGGIHYQTAWSI